MSPQFRAVDEEVNTGELDAADVDPEQDLADLTELGDVRLLTVTLTRNGDEPAEVSDISIKFCEHDEEQSASCFLVSASIFGVEAGLGCASHRVSF